MDMSVSNLAQAAQMLTNAATGHESLAHPSGHDGTDANDHDYAAEQKIASPSAYKHSSHQSDYRADDAKTTDKVTAEQ